MADYSDPKRGVAYRMTLSLFARSDNQIKTTPTLAAGDVKVSKDNGATANITTLPTETPASSGILQVDLSATEMTADLVTVIFRDAAGAEWNDVAIHLAPSPVQMGDLATAANLAIVDDFLDTEIAAIKAVTDQFSFTSGNVNVDVEMWLGTAVAATTAGTPNVNVHRINNSAGAATGLGNQYGAATLNLGAVPTSDSGTTTTLTDASLTQSDTDYWKGATINFLSGTLAGLSRTVTAFDPATDTLTFSPPTPVAVSTHTYLLLPAPTYIDNAMLAPDTGLKPIRSGTAQAGTASTVTLDAGADAADDFYNGNWVYITGGAGAGQAIRITDYVGATKVASLVSNWRVNPDSTSTFAILPQAIISANVLQWNGTFVATPTVAGVPEVDVTHWLGTGVAATAAGTPDVNVLRINNGGGAASNLQRAFNGGGVSSLTADSGTTTTLTDTGLNQANTDHWVGQTLVIASGAMSGMTRRITAFNPATDTLTFSPALPSAITTESYVIAPFSNADDLLDTEIAAIKAKTDQLNFTFGSYVLADMTHFEGSTDVAGGIRTALGLGSANLDTQLAKLDTIDDFLDTEIAAIKAKTDSLTFTVAGKIDANVHQWLGTAVGAATAGTPDVNVVRLANNASSPTGANRFFAGAGAVQADSGTTTTLTDAGLTQANADHWVGQTLVLASGTMAGMARRITAFNPATDTITFAPALPSAITFETYCIVPTSIPADSVDAEALLDLADGVETGLTVRETLRLMAAAMVGKVSGAGTGTEVFRDVNDTKDRITATVDVDGNRTTVTKDPT